MKNYLKRKLTILSNPTRYKFIIKEFGNKPFRLLDIGAGNYSATKTKTVFPNCDYYGLDKTREYNYTKEDFSLMKDFYELDLTELKFDIIPDNFFDVIVMSHIIEHLINGDKVIEKLIPKLKANGLFYIEYPGIRSTKLPSMRGTLNFFDDLTHVRIYDLKELYNLFLKEKFATVKGGTRRNLLRILFSPPWILVRFIKNRNLVGSDFWDLFGFAEYVIAQKSSIHKNI